MTRSRAMLRREVVVPEGDTLRRLAQRIDERFTGRTVERSVFRHPRLALLDLGGQALVSADAVGKHLLLRFDSGHTLHVHLLMDGRVHLDGAQGAEAWRRRFELHFGNSGLVGVDIPRLHWIATRREDLFTGHLGPDVCGRYDHDAALARLAAQRGRPLAEVVLDQRVVAGFGNVYAVETPFIVGLSPFTPVDEIGGLEELLSVGVALIRANVALGAQNTTGRHLARDDHHVLDRRIRHCGICGETVQRLAGTETPWRRRTAWCPTCQDETHRRVDRPRARRLLALHPARRLLDPADLRLATETDHPVTGGSGPVGPAGARGGGGPRTP